MQCRVWSEMKASVIHASLDEPPTNSMFKRTGKNALEAAKIKNNLSEAITHAAVALHWL